MLALSSQGALAASQVSSVEAYPGITYAVYTTGGARPTTIHVTSLNLSSSEINIVATSSIERGLRPSAFAALRGAQIVINGDLFSPLGFRPAGLARGETITWEDSVDDAISGFIAFSKGASGTAATISPPTEVAAALEMAVSAAVGGRPLLVSAGAALDPECDDTATLACMPAPRTAVATSSDGRTLYLIVADGWQAGSYGISAAELAVFVAVDLGARSALQLDSGSASAMFIENQGGLVSSPSDGAERTVANHIAVLHGELPPGAIQGGVFDTVVGGEMIIGATVTLDTGAEVTYTGELWSFAVSPRYVCASGSAPGFQDQTQCRQILSGRAEYASMALLPEGVERPDGGATSGDAGPGSDAGVDDPPGEGCGCTSGGPRGSGPLAVLALFGALFAIRLRWKSPLRDAP